MGLLGGYQRSIQELQVSCTCLCNGPAEALLTWGSACSCGMLVSQASTDPFQVLSTRLLQDNHSVLVVRLQGENKAFRAEVGNVWIVCACHALAVVKVARTEVSHTGKSCFCTRSELLMASAVPSRMFKRHLQTPSCPHPGRRRSGCGGHMGTQTLNSARSTTTSEGCATAQTIGRDGRRAGP